MRQLQPADLLDRGSGIVQAAFAEGIVGGSALAGLLERAFPLLVGPLLGPFAALLNSLRSVV
jgi:hypothetical protein